MISLIKRALRAIVDAGCNTHTNPIEKRLNLLSLPELHQTKLLCLYKNILDNKTPQNITQMFPTVTSNVTPTEPRTKLYKTSTRFELPEYLLTAPDELTNAKDRSYVAFKGHIKKYIIERYSSLCTKVGCNACHLHIKFN